MDRLWDFPRWVLLSRETGMDFIETLQRYLEISDLLGVSAIIAQLAQFIPHDSWERRLFWATQQDFKDAVCVIVRSVLRDQADKSRDYFRPLKRSQQLSVVKSWTQEIRSAAPTSLMPYLALARAINKLARL
jgi:NAD-specific glutamate dehydrogenase